MHFQAVWVHSTRTAFSRSFGKSLKQEVFHSLRQQAGKPWRDCVLGSGAHSMSLPRAASFGADRCAWQPASLPQLKT